MDNNLTIKSDNIIKIEHPPTACLHDKLQFVGSPFITGLQIRVEDKISPVCEHFMWRKYSCCYCGKIVTILSAVVERIERVGDEKTC